MFTHLPIVIRSALRAIRVEDKVPDLDIGRLCRVEAQDGSGYDLNQCIADETEARQQISSQRMTGGSAWKRWRDWLMAEPGAFTIVLVHGGMVITGVVNGNSGVKAPVWLIEKTATTV